MYKYSLIFEDGYLIDGSIQCMNDLKELVIDVIDESESLEEKDNFVLTIAKLCH